MGHDLEKQILVTGGWEYSTKFYTGRLSPFNCNQGCHFQGKVREKRNFFKVRENLSVKSQGILFSCL